MSNSDETSVTQAVWSENSPQQYLRTGLTVWGVNAGQSDFTLQALPDDGEAAPLDGVLSIINNGAAMSANFTPGGFTAAEADALALYGELRFTLGESFRGVVMCGETEIARVAEIDLGEDGAAVEAIIINAEIYSEQSEIAILAAAYETDTLVLHTRAAWKDRSAATTWGGWVAGEGGGGSPVPRGIICMWSGEESDTPYGWALCDGNNGTPDLRDKFIVGASATKAVNATGGANSATTNTTGAHTHTVGNTNTAGAHAHTVGNTNAAGAHTHTNSATGSTTLTAAMLPSHRHATGPSLGNTTDGKNEYAPFGAGSATGTGRYCTGGASGSGVFAYSDYTGSGTGHAHTMSATGSAGSHSHTVGNTDSAGSHSHTVGNADSNGDHSHTVATMPPWYALAYIMKL